MFFHICSLLDEYDTVYWTGNVVVIVGCVPCDFEIENTKTGHNLLEIRESELDS